MILEKLIDWKPGCNKKTDITRRIDSKNVLKYFDLHKELETDFGSMELKIEISKLLYMERYDAAALKLQYLKEYTDCREGSNYQYVIFTKAIIDSSLGKINKEEYLEELYYAIHISKPSYKPTKRLKGLLTKQETLIIINIALFYRRTGDMNMAYKVLSQLARYYRKNSINFEQNAAALVWINLAELLEEMGEYKVGVKIAEEGLRLELRYTKGIFLNRLLMSIIRNVKSLEKETQFLKDIYNNNQPIGCNSTEEGKGLVYPYKDELMRSTHLYEIIS